MLRVSILALALAAACAPSTGLDADEKQDLMNALTSTMNSAGNARARDDGPLPNEILPDQAFGHTLNCPAGGHITITGNITIYTNAVTYISTVNYGDRSNNLNDCLFSNGLVIDGTLYMNLVAYQTYGRTTINGSLELGRKGPTNGIVPIESCFIDLLYDTRIGKLQGTVCGDAI